MQQLLNVTKDASLADWLADRRNRRIIPHRLEPCGYAPVRNPDAEDGLWKLNSKRQVIYTQVALTPREQIAAARERIRSV
jgi:hypothetical protein